MTAPLKIVFAVTETGPQAASGDLFTASELGQALQMRYGWDVAYHPRGDAWYTLPDADVVVAMLDDYDPRQIRAARPQLIRVAWARNWFERWACQPWMAHFDLILASSQQAVRHLSEATGQRAQLLRLATNPARFNCQDRATTPSLDFVFSGSYWGSPRDVVAALSALPKRFKGAIHGKHWEQHPQLAHWNRGFLAYERLPEVYAQAHIVIDDGNHVTKDWGAANSRVFDALAAGCLVITNAQSVADACFEGLLPVYRNPQHLAALLDQHLADPAATRVLQSTLQTMVLRHHSYAHRAYELHLHLQRLQNRRSPFISIVVPLFNHLAETQAMLASLLSSLAHREDWELVLIDDASTDSTRAWLDTLRLPRLKVLKNTANQGFARTNNRAVAECRGEVLVLANNDLVFSPGWLEPMLSLLLDPARQAGLVGNVQTRVVDGAIDHTGVDLNHRGQLDHIRVWPAPRPADEAVERFAVTAACIALRRERYLALGGLDERYVNGCEDMDLCFKVTASGLKNWVALNSVVKHHVSLSRGANANAQHERNSALLFRCWWPVLQARLAQKWLAWLQHGEVTEPSDGRDDLALPAPARSVGCAAAEGVARSVMQRNADAQASLLGQALAAPAWPAVPPSADWTPSPLAGHAHPAQHMAIALPAGAGLHGLFVLGQVTGAALGAPAGHIGLLLNGVQRGRWPVTVGDFNLGWHRPLVWADQASVLQLSFEIDGHSQQAPKVFLSQLLLDGSRQVAFVATPGHRADVSPAQVFVQLAYQRLLGRQAEPLGFEAYVNHLQQGMGHEQLWSELAHSDEAIRYRQSRAPEPFPGLASATGGTRP